MDGGFHSGKIAMDCSLGVFGDVRLDRAGADFIARMVAGSTVCVRRLGVSRGGVLRFGRVLGSARVTVEKIIAGWSAATTIIITRFPRIRNRGICGCG